MSAAKAGSSTQGLPNVDPIFTWVRLAQRIPVRIRIEQVPPEVSFVAGMTCSVSVVGGKGMPVARRDRGLFYRLESLLYGDPMSAPRDIDLGGILVAPFVRYLLLAFVILIAVRFVVGPLTL